MAPSLSRPFATRRELRSVKSDQQRNSWGLPIISPTEVPSLDHSEELTTQDLYPRENLPTEFTEKSRTGRSEKVRKWWERPADNAQPKSLTGLALSGGGIRSATFSLGVIQALAKSRRNAFGRIDILSTVSGGGYIGCFLRSLFMPEVARGIDPNFTRPQWDAGLDDQYAFGDALLATGVRARNIRWHGINGPVVRRNPLWWLREHSRYLAPNGPTDYSYAAAYLARNWLAMLYIFVIACMAIIIGLVALERGYVEFCTVLPTDSISASIHHLSRFSCPASVAKTRLIVSPSLILAIPISGFCIVTCCAYWITQGMSPNEPNLKKQLSTLLRTTFAAFAGGIAIFLSATWVTTYASRERAWRGPEPLTMLSAWWRWVHDNAPLLPPPSATAGPNETLLQYATALAIAMILLGIILALGFALAILASLKAGDRVTLTVQLRTKLTRSLANANLILLALIAVGCIDTLGAWLAEQLPHWLQPGRFKWTILFPALAYLIKKLPDWLGRSKSIASSTTLQRFLPAVAALAGFALFGGVAVICAAAIHFIAWKDYPWDQIAAPTFALATILVVALAILAGGASGIINLSSLHSLYASRLTRAFLGATNNHRLFEAAEPGTSGNIKETEPADYIDPRNYFGLDLPAPIHLVNITLNETIDPESQLVSRDRKGQLLTLEPRGVAVADQLVTWDTLSEGRTAEPLSLGQWCAISGAAVSSGMGRYTSLGYALTLTFANVRLGYWWYAPGLFEKARKTPFLLVRFIARWSGTFVYLGNEMLARYSRFYQRKYLTDGGHFDNSAAYRLIARNVPLIIVCDNGADPDYRFEDLENLARKARLDLGKDIALLRDAALLKLFEDLGAVDRSIFVDPGDPADWRDQLTDEKSSAFVVALGATHGDQLTRILWMKPRVIGGLPPDVRVYASANPPFPQQSTGDQFFDEAQWESYRALGEFCMTRLLRHCPDLLSSYDFGTP